MDRFIAFIWDADRPDLMRQVSRWFADAKSKSPAWTPVYDNDGLLVIALPNSRGAAPDCALSPATGVIIGTVFAGDDARPTSLKQLPNEAAERIIASKGADLIGAYWGSFVGILRDAGRRETYVIRDPCGAAACYYTRSNGVTLLSSFVDDIADFSGLHWSVDWGTVQAFLVSNFLINRRTGLRELTEVMPGERVTFQPDGTASPAPLWNPVEISQTPKRQSFKDASEEFRVVAEQCMAGWTHDAGNVLVRMSGGLDSTIVAALARQASRQTVAGVHLVGRGYEAFELNLAREAATYLDIPLEEKSFDQQIISFRGALSGPRSPRPSKQILGADADRKLSEVSDAFNAQTVMSGHGGDAIFLQRSIAGDAIIDHILTRGSLRSLAGVAYDTATLLETSVWHVLGNAASHLAGRRRWDPMSNVKESGARAHDSFATKAFFGFPPGAMSSAWLEEARQLPPCKAEQVRNVVALRNYHSARGHAEKRQSIHPLISQPLIELSLRTPAHLFSTGGQDRSLERAAFADLIPASITRRFHKGFVNHSAIAGIVEDLDFLRDLVMNGRCVDAGLLDRNKLERLLSAEHLLEGKSLSAVLDLVAVEAWLSGWMPR